MAQSIYGGRIDNEFDQRLLNTFLERLFTTSSFDSEFKLALKVDGHKDIKMPDGIRSAQSRFSLMIFLCSAFRFTDNAQIKTLKASCGHISRISQAKKDPLSVVNGVVMNEEQLKQT